MTADFYFQPSVGKELGKESYELSQELETVHSFGGVTGGFILSFQYISFSSSVNVCFGYGHSSLRNPFRNRADARKRLAELLSARKQ